VLSKPQQCRRKFCIARVGTRAGLALYLTVFFGTTTSASVIWGKFARGGGMPAGSLPGGRRSDAGNNVDLAVWKLHNRLRRPQTSMSCPVRSSSGTGKTIGFR